MSNLNICVLGAGVVGLTTALELQKEFNNATITIIADKFNDKTTSYVAPALYYPSNNLKGPTEDITKEWFTASFHHWKGLLNNNIGAQVGISEVSGYLFSNKGPNAVRNTYIESFIPGFRLLPPDELECFPGNWKYGSELNTLVIENGIYLPWAMNKFLNNSGRIIGQKVERISDLAGKYNAVVNCSGIGARILCNDNNVIPIRGQIYKVRAPWVDKFYFVDDTLTYIIPGYEGVTLGTIYEENSFDVSYNQQQEIDIQQRCAALLPKIKDSKIIARRVGLRPYRNIVRVEHGKENLVQTPLKVVHCYGHSGNGVTTAPGTAKYAAKLLQEALMNTKVF